MQRWTAVAVGAFSLVMIGALVLKGGGHGLLTDASGDGGPEGPKTGTTESRRPVEGGVLDDPFFVADIDGGLLPLLPAPAADPGAQLPAGSPKMVRFGVILVQYRGAQGASASSRSKDQALELARSLAAAARADFKGQVAKGDPGSMDDAGRIPRGVLEPPAEYALFTLSPGGVSDPVDTPRGYWIVKRIE